VLDEVFSQFIKEFLPDGSPGQTMTGAISSLAIGSDQVKSASGFQPVPRPVLRGLLLFVITFALNVASERVVRRVRRDY